MIVTDAQAELNHATNVASELRQLHEVGAGSEQGDVEEQPVEVLRNSFRHVHDGLLLQLVCDGVLRVDIH
eukprot:7468474-Heterocapsa_arctica.AAC.1